MRENRARIVAVSIERFGIDRGGDEIAGGIVKPSVRDVVAIKIERRLLSAREKKTRAVPLQKIDFARVGQRRSGARAPHLLEAVHLRKVLLLAASGDACASGERKQRRRPKFDSHKCKYNIQNVD